MTLARKGEKGKWSSAAAALPRLHIGRLLRYLYSALQQRAGCRARTPKMPQKSGGEVLALPRLSWHPPRPNFPFTIDSTSFRSFAPQPPKGKKISRSGTHGHRIVMFRCDAMSSPTLPSHWHHEDVVGTAGGFSSAYSYLMSMRCKSLKAGVSPEGCAKGKEPCAPQRSWPAARCHHPPHGEIARARPLRPPCPLQPGPA